MFALAAGEQCHGSEPGFFRFCWAWMPHSAMKPVVDRIARLLAARVAERTAAASRQQPEVQEGEADSTAAMATSSTTTV